MLFFSHSRVRFAPSKIPLLYAFQSKYNRFNTVSKLPPFIILDNPLRIRRIWLNTSANNTYYLNLKNNKVDFFFSFFIIIKTRKIDCRCRENKCTIPFIFWLCKHNTVTGLQFVYVVIPISSQLTVRCASIAIQKKSIDWILHTCIKYRN